MPARDGAPAPRVFLSGGPLKDVILTPEGYEKLKQEIEFLSNEKRREVADRIRTAREFGDIAENAEYDDAKNEQALLEHRIATLEERLRNAPRDQQEGRREGRRLDRLEGEAARHRREADLRVPHRRLRRGEPGREQALERVAGRARRSSARRRARTVEVAAPRGSMKFKILEIKAA
jgi:transcription elongation factor GreA